MVCKAHVIGYTTYIFTREIIGVTVFLHFFQQD